MISWIQRTFQQHFKWLFLILLVLVIISFVFITNASSGLGHGHGQKIPDRPFFGLNLSKIEDQRVLIEDAQLSLYLRQPAFRPDPSPAEVEQYALQRHASLHFASELRLPSPSPSDPAVAAYIQTLGRFAGPDGKFDPKAYSGFIDSLKTNPRLTEGDIARVVIDDIRAEAYRSLLAGPGYVLPADLSEQLARRDTTWTLAIATIDGQGFAPKIEAGEAALAAWFETNARRYEIGARVSVSGVRIPSAGFANAITLTDAEIRAAYDANPSRYPAPADAKTEAGKEQNADAVFALVRTRVEADLRKQRAEKAALAAADDLTVKLLEQRVAADKLPAFLAAQNLALEDIGLVGQGAIPASLGGAAAAQQILPEVLRLGSDRPYSNSLPAPEGAVVLVWRESVPARVPALSEVKDKVLADYQAEEKRRLFNEAGRKLRETVLAAVTSGKPFAEAVSSAATAAGLKAEIKTPAPFSLAKPAPEIDYTAFQALSTLNQGGVSDFLPSRENGAILVHALKKDTPAFDPASPAAAEIKGQLGPILAERNAQGMLTAMIEAELAKSAPATE